MVHTLFKNEIQFEKVIVWYLIVKTPNLRMYKFGTKVVLPQTNELKTIRV